MNRVATPAKGARIFQRQQEDQRDQRADPIGLPEQPRLR